MKTDFSIGVEAVVVLLLSIVGVAGLSFLMLGDFNAGIVELTNFTPQISSEYEQYFQFSAASMTLTMVFALSSALLIILHSKTKNNKLRIFGALFVFLFIFTVFFSIALFNSFNEVITSAAIRFDLNLTTSWNNFYQGYAFGFFILQSIIVAIGAITLALIPISNRIPIKSTLPKAISFMFLTVGASIIGFSILYDSVISLLAGLGLAFWGSSLIFVSAGSYIKKEVAEATSLYYLDSFSNIFDQIGTANEAIYLPSNYSKCAGTNKIYNVKNGKEKSHDFDRGLQEELLGAKDAQLMKAPSSDLLTLFEKAAGKKFETADYPFFERAIPKLLVEDLDIAQNVRVERADSVVQVKIETPLDHVFYAEARLHPRLLASLGTPLSSAIACALANSTRKPVLTRNHSISADGKILEIDYLVLDSVEA